jgi:photosystem II stability/assembly factor-like uncharacterized protein
MKATLILLVVTSVSFADWFSVPSGTSNNLEKLFFVNSATGYVCGANGTIRKTTNGGDNWFGLTSGTSEGLYGIFISPLNPAVGYCVGDNGIILRTTNSGVNWSQGSHGGAHLTVAFKDMNTGITGDVSGFVYRTTNGGINWNAVDLGIIGTAIYNYYITSSYIFGACSGGKVIKSTNGGANWSVIQAVGAGNLWDIYFEDNNTGYACDHAGKIFKTTNSGLNWQQISSTTGTKTTITTNGLDLYLCGLGGKIGKSTNSGANWFFQTTGTNMDFNNMQFVNTTTGFAVGEAGSIYKTTNAGEPIGVQNISGEVPAAFSLSQNYPNPFNPVTNIEFSISKSSFVRITVYDILGKKVAQPVNQNLAAGKYRSDFDASTLNSGVYFYKLETEWFTETKKMILIK